VPGIRAEFLPIITEWGELGKVGQQTSGDVENFYGQRWFRGMEGERYGRLSWPKHWLTYN